MSGEINRSTRFCIDLANGVQFGSDLIEFVSKMGHYKRVADSVKASQIDLYLFKCNNNKQNTLNNNI